MSDGEPSLDPGYLLSAVRSFLAGAAQPAADEVAEQAKPGAEGEPEGEDGLGWEEAGCLVWDSAALPDDAAFLVKHDLLAMLPPLLTAAAAHERWRALEIALGTLGNLACHGTKQLLLGQAGLPHLLLDTVLWVDDSASLAELCRCLTSLMADSSRQATDAWWALLLREETLGRLVWVVENTLSPALLERSLNLVCCLVATAAAAGDGGATSQQLVPPLLALDLLPLLASVLHGWVVRLRAEHQQFGGGGRTAADPRAEIARGSSGAAVGAAATEAPAADEEGAEDPPLGADVPAVATIAPPGPDSPVQWEEKAVAAAEVTQDAAMEALGLLEALQADAAGEEAINASAPVKEALMRVVAASDSRGMRALATALLAAAEGVGPLLMQHPRALEAALGRLEAAAAEAGEGQPAKRARTEAGEGETSAAERQAGEEVEAAWALCSELARSLPRPPPAGEGGAADGAAEHVAPSGSANAVLAVLAEHAGVLGYQWGDDDASLAAHQAYVLGRALPLLAGRLGEAAAAELAAAADRAQAAAQQ